MCRNWRRKDAGKLGRPVLTLVQTVYEDVSRGLTRGTKGKMGSGPEKKLVDGLPKKLCIQTNEERRYRISGILRDLGTFWTGQ